MVDTAIDRSLIQFKKYKELFQITTLQELVSKTKPSNLPNNEVVWSCEDNYFNLIKLFSKKQVPVEDNTSLKNFLESCSCDQDSHASFSFEIYLCNSRIFRNRIKHANNTITLLYSRLLKCMPATKILLDVNHVSLILTENKEMEIEEPFESEYRLIQIIDRGSLKWPSSDVIYAIITLWKLFSSIESPPSLFDSFITGPPRSILIQLTTTIIEDEQNEIWRVVCNNCGTLMWDVLAKLLRATSYPIKLRT